MKTKDLEVGGRYLFERTTGAQYLFSATVIEMAETAILLHPDNGSLNWTERIEIDKWGSVVVRERLKSKLDEAIENLKQL
jgi:hypothetical protein